MFRLSSEDRAALIQIARRAISSAVLQARLLDFPPYAPSLGVPRGAFVTLHNSGKLRGCMGQVENPGPLADVVARSAINAALHDPRFPPVGAREVATLDIELSVLSPLEPIAAEAVIPGQHGLMVIRESYKGILLPQVAAERRWSRQRFLEETCTKAGLPRDAWSDPATRMLGFTAEVFSEA